MAQINNYDWLYCIPQGWEKIGQQMIQECEAIDPEYQILDMKEKYGMLRTYSIYSQDEIPKIESRYEDISSKICCICGKPATKISTGWICPYCDDCGDKDEKFYKRFK